jgi:hypothetical protein
MIKQNSTLAEQASKNNGPTGAKAKEIFLGIDAHLRSNQVARKIDSSAIGAVRLERCRTLVLKNCCSLHTSS